MLIEEDSSTGSAHSGTVRNGIERYKVTLAYDGTQFFGFQRQGQDRTVQLEVEAALRKMNWQGQTILASGRTDSGVHADGQVIAFDLHWPHGLDTLAKALNANLPFDVAVKAVEVAQADFHPRFDASSRSYQYQVLFSPVRDPRRSRYAWRVWPPCDFDLLQAAAQLLHGTYDFAAFGTPPRPGGSTIRTVFRANWQTKEVDTAQFDVTANAFLYHMVRRMVYMQVQVGQKRLSLEALQSAVTEARPVAPGLAPPWGLSLKEVRYEERSANVNGQVT